MYQNIGIYRKIPLKNNITRTDGTTSKNRAKISNINVSDNFTTYNEDGYKVIKIGNANSTYTGKHTYTISYTYDIGKDPLKDADELYYNLIGTEWDTSISNVKFSIKMPKSFDKSLLGFSRGSFGSSNSSNINYEVDGNVITGYYDGTLSAGQGLTVRLTLPEGYFVRFGFNFDIYSVSVIIISLIFVLISDRLWAKYGKDDHVVETVEFYPPEGYNSAEVGYLYNGKADDKSVISLLIYLANKGYLKIEETEKQELFKSSKGFKLIKLKDYDGNNENERIFFNALFKNRASVTESGLYDKFYITLSKIENNLNKEENKNKIFDKNSKGKSIWMILMNVIIFILITVKPVLDASRSIFYYFCFTISRDWLWSYNSMFNWNE